MRNLTFQPPETLEQRGIPNLVAKVLCSKHNSDLSRFDSAGLALFSGMDRIDSAAGNYGESPETIPVKGDDLERWMLKTLCSGLFSGNIAISGGSLKSVMPPLDLLNILFEDEQLPAEQGLYVRTPSPGSVFSTEPAVLKIEAVSDATNVVIGIRVCIFNFEFVLVLAPLPSQFPPSLEHAHYRPKGIIFHGRNGSSKRIPFEWQNADAGEELQVICFGHPQPSVEPGQ